MLLPGAATNIGGVAPLPLGCRILRAARPGGPRPRVDGIAVRPGMAKAASGSPPGDRGQEIGPEQLAIT
jgi:hypothetical protein